MKVKIGDVVRFNKDLDYGTRKGDMARITSLMFISGKAVLGFKQPNHPITDVASGVQPNWFCTKGDEFEIINNANLPMILKDKGENKMSVVEKKDIYEYTKGMYSTLVYIDHSFDCIFFKTEYPSWAKAAEKEEFLEAAAKAVMDELEKDFHVGV